MLFNFLLHPVDCIAPWGSQEQPTLHWFGLTDGWYWMDVGIAELFRCREDILQLWGFPADGKEHLPYVDYPVVRLWEDLQGMLPAILEPIPNYVLQHVQPGALALRWRKQMIDDLMPEETDVPDDVYARIESATSWLNDRWLDVGYLRFGPRIWFWRQDETVVIHWDNSEIQCEGIHVWTADVGSITLPLQQFINEVRSFDQRLLQAMQDRVDEVQQHWSRPEITLNIPALRREQQERATWMENAFKRARHKPSTNWQDVAEIIEHLKNHA